MLRALVLLAAVAGVSHAAPPAASAIAYSPNGAVVAAGLHGSVRLFDATTGTETGAVDGLPGRVTAVAFAPGGGLLAVACGEPGKVGRVEIYTVTPANAVGPRRAVVADAHKDSVYAVAFRPDGKTLATAGYDKLVRLWDVSGPAGDLTQPARTLTDHSDAVYALAFHPDGKLLASAAADRAVKVWDVDTGTRLYTLGDATDWLYAVAWSPDGKAIAAGGVDKSVRVWAVTRDGGTLNRSAFAHAKAVTRLAYTADGKTLFSTGEDGVVKAWDAAALRETAVLPARADSVLAFAVRPDGKQVAVGRYDGVAELLDPATGKPQHTLLPAKPKPPTEKTAADRFPAVREAGITDSARLGMKVQTPVTVVGKLDRAGDVDFYRFEAKAGDEIGVHLVPADPKVKFEPVVVLTDAGGMTLAEGTDRLGYVALKAGVYAVGVRDKDYRGGADLDYRLHVGPVPVVTSVFPLGVGRGKTTPVRVTGVNLGLKTPDIAVAVPADAVPGSRVPVPVPKVGGEVPLGMPSVVVDEFPTAAVGPDGTANLPTVPATADGVLGRPGQSHAVRFTARKGEPLVAEVNARRVGSPVDSALEVVDAAGRPVPRAVLRSTAKMAVALRDHDSDKPGIRLDAYNEVAVDDYLYADGELCRVLELPRNMDDDCQFFQVGGKRVGFLGTTPAFHPLGGTLYRVEVHPPGTTFPPNGMPVFPVDHRNDDGGPGYGSDSVIRFDPPADGVYTARVADARGAGGPAHAYRLTVRPPRPDFGVSFAPTAPAVVKGGGVAVAVTVTRADGFDGRIDLRLEGLPPGVTAPPTYVEGNLTTATLGIAAEPTAAVPAKVPPVRLVARATIAGKDVTREATGTLRVVAPVDIATTVRQPEVVIRPGRETRFVVDVERRDGFAGRIPVDVRGLPHGVRVLNVGLNGILITERDTSREVVLHAEPWVKPTDRPFVVVARRESKAGAEHAARPIILRVRE